MLKDIKFPFLSTKVGKLIFLALSLVFIAPAIIFLIITTRYLTGQNAALGGFGKL